MRRRLMAIGILAASVLVAIVLWRNVRRPASPARLLLYGNIDLREVDLPFNETERIAEVLVQEGDRVHAGQLVARLDTARLAPQVAQAAALVAAQRQVVLRLHHGNRPEEVAEARADLASAQADADNARDHYDRLRPLAAQHVVSQQDLDNAKSALDMAQAKLAMNEKALQLEEVGPRREDVAQAEAQLSADEAELALLRRHLVDASLLAPTNAVVEARLMEPGEIASPEKPVLSLAITDPKWVRAYVSEPNLGRVRPGMAASITVDAFENREFPGWVGFVSPVAEFTPKDVQTEALRPSLVYEVRVFVRDSLDVLRLGMPATVTLATTPVVPEQDLRRSVPVPVVPDTASSNRQ